MTNAHSHVAFTARRALVLAPLAAAALGRTAQAQAQDDEPGSEERPQKADLLVFAEGEREGTVITLGDLPVGGPPALAWPMDPKTKVVRKGSRLNQLLVLRLDPTAFDEATSARAADGVVAYSAICAHAGCVVTGWVRDLGKDVLKCPCHNSEYDPTKGGEVVFGPAPRHLAGLPLALSRMTITVAGPFAGRVGPQLS